MTVCILHTHSKRASITPTDSLVTLLRVTENFVFIFRDLVRHQRKIKSEKREKTQNEKLKVKMERKRRSQFADNAKAALTMHVCTRSTHARMHRG